MTIRTETEPALKTYRFTFTLGGVPEVPAGLSDVEFNERMDGLMDELGGRVHAAGCDDASLSARGQTFFLGFDREAGSLGKAIGSAVEDVVSAGLAVARVEVDEDMP